MSSSEKLCPFDKKPCITAPCAIWSTENGMCALALIPAAISGMKPASSASRAKEKMASSGLSGKFRDPLFD
ncbi:MAG TPA: hypothetical protein VN429_09755 [Methanospirillum sp.]|uniref:hypothetical protein n=1 Tax=Methanospirillum sp. TaxID=45200 RepID=UPI002B988552|nr:hypothetical protein [Methanospirillum sp.]HWQ64686.1 hypothetical protein [Methanospirillum sp.]